VKEVFPFLTAVSKKRNGKKIKKKGKNFQDKVFKAKILFKMLTYSMASL
jgi:hypothetical protein